MRAFIDRFGIFRIDVDDLQTHFITCYSLSHFSIKTAWRLLKIVMNYCEVLKVAINWYELLLIDMNYKDLFVIAKHL